MPADGSAWVEQTFVSRRGGLNTVTIQIEVLNASEAEINASLVDETNQVQVRSPGYWQVVRSGPVTFRFENRAMPDTFHLRLSARNAAIQLKGSTDDFYPGGSAISGSIADAPTNPLPGDLAFSTGYDYHLGEAWVDFQNGISQIWLALPLAFVLLLPGALLISLFQWENGLDLGEWLAFSSGLSLSVLPLLMLWTGLAHLAWSTTAVMAGAAALLLAAFYLVWKRKPWKNWHPDWIDLALLAAFLGALVLRLVMVRDMAGPAWVDGVHHALITRLVMAQGMLPQSFAPFFEIAPTDYHPGYHVGLAAFTWLSGLDLLQSMLIYGQILNALAVPAAYLFTHSLTRSRLAGLAAAVFCGFCTPMPAYYTSWSRYTQLAGLLILPVILAGMRRLIEQWSKRPSQEAAKITLKGLLSAAWQISPIWLAAAGLVLVHYRVAAFCALLMLAWFGLQAWRDSNISIHPGRWLGLAFGSAALAGIAVLPWLIPLLSQTLLKPMAGGPAPAWFSDFSWQYLTAGLGSPVMALAAMGLVFGLLSEKRFTWVILAWAGGLALLANPRALGLPAILSNNITMEITLFMPLCALAGEATRLSILAAARLGWEWYKPAVAGMGIAVALLGAQQIMPILNEGTMLLRQADLPALTWAEQNLPADSLVATNPFLWGYGSYAGADGGYWLAPVSGVRSIPLPVAANSSQSVFTDNNRISEAIVQSGSQPDQLARLLRQEGITYIFSGQRGGPISPQALASSQAFVTRYHQDGVWVFYISP